MTTKRNLTQKEIDDILDFIRPQLGIPKEVAMSIVKINKEKFLKQLVGVLVYPSIIPKLKKQLQETYERSKIQAGESVGIITAQSFGQFQTQSTLNSFHKAGLSEKTVVSGVSRFTEILDATKSPKGASCVIYFKDDNDSLEKLRGTIGHSVVGLTLKQISDKMTIVMEKGEEPWYGIFEKMYNNNFRQHTACISVKFNQKSLYQYNLTLETIAKKIEATYADLFCVFSPLHMLRMDIFVDMAAIQLPEKMMHYVTSENMYSVYVEDVVLVNLEKFLVCGIEGISNMFFTSEKNEWFIETEGSNFSDVLAHPKVDISRTFTNDIWEIYNTLGIEATRQYMIEELTSSMSGINPCHSRLLADKMTYNGIIVSISRYGMRSEGSGALAKASFEETLDNILNAAAHGEKETTDGVSVGIICGKLGRFGTGICDVRLDVPKLLGMPPIVEDTVEEIIEFVD
jgi:DNA-directed RNA polymerase beta' subunit